MIEKLLQIRNLNKSFEGIKAVDDLSLEIYHNETIGLIGPNGAGKTTLFNVITGFLKEDSGNILFLDKNTNKMPSYKIARLGISRTFQILRLIKQITVIENILLACENKPGEHIRGIFFQSGKVKRIEKQNRGKALGLLEYAGILDKQNELADNLSYGQQKLLSILCCLATDAKLFLFDEPIAGINPEMAEKILKIIKELPGKGKTVMIIEHNMNVIKDICNRVIFMDAGKKIAEGTPDEVLNDPRVIESYLD